MIPSPFHGIFSTSFEGAQRAVAKEGNNTLPSPLIAETAAGQRAQGQVAIDVYEYENYYIIKAPIAGVKMSDIDIEVNDRSITIRGTRRQKESIPDNQYYVQECYWGDFSRSIKLPCSIDPRKVKATFNKECVLKVLVPKEEEKVKIIQISE